LRKASRAGAVAALLGLGLAAAPAALIVTALSSSVKGIPDEWRLKATHGMPDVQAVDDGDGRVLRLRSRKTSFALERELDVDLAATPVLTWRWKVVELPAGGDFRHLTSDDQAAQLMVGFSDRRVVSYIWDSTAPQGTLESASRIPFLHIQSMVVRSGPAELNRWLTETRNVAEDYQRAYGKPATRVRGLRLQINSQHTGTSAESYFGDISFRNMP
jgi:DUF3047 family protein